MSRTQIDQIKKQIDAVNNSIKVFLVDMNEGVIRDLSGLDDNVKQICTDISKLDKPAFEELRPDFEDSLKRVQELREFLSNELETTSKKIHDLDTRKIASQQYARVANDN